MPQEKVKFAGFLKAQREKSGFSQSEVAEKMGYATPQFISKWERGLATPPFNALGRLASLYRMDPDELLTVALEIKVEKQKKIKSHSKNKCKKTKLNHDELK